MATHRLAASREGRRRAASLSGVSDGHAPQCLGGLAVILAALLVGCSAGAGHDAPKRDHAPEAVTGTVWLWERTVTPAATVESPAPGRYTLELAPNGRLLATADCNRGTGTYRIGAGTIAIDPIATTRRACPPGSLDATYLRDLQRATAFQVAGGALLLELAADSGTMRFVPKP